LKQNWNERTRQFRVFEKAESKYWLILDVINPQRTAGFYERTAGSLLVLSDFIFCRVGAGARYHKMFQTEGRIFQIFASARYIPIHPVKESVGIWQ